MKRRNKKGKIQSSSNILEDNLLHREPRRRRRGGRRSGARENFFYKNCFKKLIFGHVYDIIKKGAKKPYEFDMLFELDDQFLYEDFEAFESFFDKNYSNLKNDYLKLLIKYNRSYVRIVYIFYIFRYVAEISFPLLLKQMLVWIELEDKDMREGYLYGGLISVALLVRSYTGVFSDYVVELINARIRNSTRALIVNKVSSLAPGARKYVDIGKVANNMVVDINKLTFYMVFRPNLLYVPIALTIYLYLILSEVGSTGLTSIIIFTICLWIQSKIDASFQKANLSRMKISDKRGKKINEIIAGAKIIKFNAWEVKMNRIVKNLRKIEGFLIKKAFTLYNMSHAVSTIIPTILGLTIFLLYDYFHVYKLEVASVYELITLFNATLIPVRYFIMATLGRQDALAASQRISEILQIKPIRRQEDNIFVETGTVEITNGCFNWEDPKYYQLYVKQEMKPETRNAFILSEISLKIEKGEFVAVIGKVGSGKSSLLLAMMDEMVRHRGEVSKRGRIAYISQESFLQNDTILSNITFGAKFDENRFNEVLRVCEMQPDLAILPGRELTEIGERGVNMSGGQKQRINIARAVYSESDIYLIDDALSALDAYVGKKIMENVFIKKLAGKTRVLVTHYLHLLDHVDKVVLMEDGRIVEFGTVEAVRGTKAFQAFANSAELKKSLEGDLEWERVLREVESPQSKARNALEAENHQNEGSGGNGQILESEVVEEGIELGGGPGGLKGPRLFTEEEEDDFAELENREIEHSQTMQDLERSVGLGDGELGGKDLRKYARSEKLGEDQTQNLYKSEEIKDQDAKNDKNEDVEVSESQEKAPKQQNSIKIEQNQPKNVGLEIDQNSAKKTKIEAQEHPNATEDLYNEDQIPLNTGRNKTGVEQLGRLIQPEKREFGAAGLHYYLYYMRNAGTCLSLVCILFFGISIASKMACDWWIGKWMSDSYRLPELTYRLIYALIGLYVFGFMIIRAILLGKVSEKAAVSIFKSILWNILRRPISFFETTSAGVIINRCTSDVDQLDYIIPWFMAFFLNMFFNFLGSLVLACVISPLVIVFLVVAVVLGRSGFNKFMKTTVELKRLVQISQAPVIAIGMEFINGATVIRAYDKKGAVLRKYRERADRHHEAYFQDEVSVTWIRLRIELCLALVVICAIFSVVLSQEYTWLTTAKDSATNALIISYLLPLSTMTGSLIYPLILLAKAAVSIQRLKEYEDWNIHEKPFSKPKAPKDWPTNGEIVVHKMCVRYRDNLPLVLKNISFRIQAGQKVAIIGRTGSGKSTSLLCFMRILEMAKDETGANMGYVMIDGQKIDQIGLHELRRNLAIIPQDPFLMQGTLRYNIDPSNEYSSSQIVAVLRAVSLLETIREEDIINQRLRELKLEAEEVMSSLGDEQKNKKLEGFKDKDEYIRSTIKLDLDPEVKIIKEQGICSADKLSFKILEGGSNLSIGQRQLVCIARALIKQPKILLMDEATANIDQKTDSIIQNLIKERLKETTVVTIAHRLITVVQYDKVIILEKGEKIEEGSPAGLLDDAASFFSGLVKEGGDEFFGKMKMAANDHSLDPAELFAD